MADIIVKIRSIINDLPDAEKAVAEYTLKNADKLPYLSIYEVAKAVDVSVASVSRLAQKLSCANFKEFKIQVAQNIDSAISAVFEGIKHDDSDEESIKKVFGGNLNSIEDTLKIIDFDGLTKLAKLICQYERVIFAGMGSSSYIAQDAALRFAHLGVQCFSFREPFEMLINTISIPQNTVFVGISHSGRASITVEAVEIANKNGAVTAGISNYPESPLAKACQIFLCTAFHETWTRATAVSSRVSQICILDALHVLTARHMKDLGIIERANQIVEDHFRRNKRND